MQNITKNKKQHVRNIHIPKTVAMAATAQKKRYKGRTTARVSKAKNAQEGSSHSFQKHSWPHKRKKAKDKPKDNLGDEHAEILAIFIPMALNKSNPTQ